MAVVISVVTFTPFANAFIAFGIAFYWQARVIITLSLASDWDKSHVPWKALGYQNSVQNTTGRFIAGEIFPDLRRKWLNAMGYVAANFLALFLVVGFLQLIASEYLP